MKTYDVRLDIADHPDKTFRVNAFDMDNAVDNAFRALFSEVGNVRFASVKWIRTRKA